MRVPKHSSSAITASWPEGWIRGSWPGAPTTGSNDIAHHAGVGVGDLLGTALVLVFSKTLRRAAWAETRIASGHLDEEIESIKARPGGYVIAYRGARFARALPRGGLVDEYRLNVQPAALGTGMPIFTELAGPLKPELVEARPVAGGNVGHVYVPRTS